MIEHYNPRALLASRAVDKSFHVVAEQHVRIEFQNMGSGQEIGPIAYAGDIVLMCWAGEFSVGVGEVLTAIREFEQGVIPQGDIFRIRCTVAGTLQLIWTPPYAQWTESDS